MSEQEIPPPRQRNPTGRPPGRARARRLEIERRRDQVAALYRACLTQTQIAERLNVSQQVISEDLKAVRSAWRARYVDNVSDVILRDAGTLDYQQQLLLARFADARGADYDASRELVRVMHRRSKLLGLDAPERKELEVRDESARESVLRKADLYLGAVDPEEVSNEPDGERGEGTPL